MKFLLDEMYSPAIAVRLVDGHGVEAVSVHDLPELRGRADEEVLERAQAMGCVVVTENVSDFRPLFNAALAQGGHYGVVFTTNDRSPRAQPRTTGALVKALAKLAATNECIQRKEYWL